MRVEGNSLGGGGGVMAASKLNVSFDQMSAPVLEIMDSSGV
jgi:hypothetical protein